MKLRCLFVSQSIYSAVATTFFNIGADYLGARRKGSSIDAFDIVVEDPVFKGETFTLTGYENKETGSIDIVTDKGVIASFTTSHKRFTKTEKRVIVKLDGVGRPDKRRARRVARQYAKLESINPGYFCPGSAEVFKRHARFHRR